MRFIFTLIVGRLVIKIGHPIRENNGIHLTKKVEQVNPDGKSTNQRNRRVYGISTHALRNLRTELIIRHGRICWRCKKTFPLNDLSLDHIVEADTFKGKDKAALNAWENLQILCTKCHEWKTVQYNRFVKGVIKELPMHRFPPPAGKVTERPEPKKAAKSPQQWYIEPTFNTLAEKERWEKRQAKRKEEKRQQELYDHL